MMRRPPTVLWLPTLLLALLSLAQLGCPSSAATPELATAAPTTEAALPGIVQLPPVTPTTLYLEPFRVWGDSRIAFWEETWPLEDAAVITGELEVELSHHADPTGLGAEERAWLQEHGVTIPTSTRWFPSDRPGPDAPLLVRTREGLIDAQARPVSLASLDAPSVRLAIDARVPARFAIELLRALGPGRLVHVAYGSTDPTEGDGSRYLLLRRPAPERDGSDPRLLYVTGQRFSLPGGRAVETTADVKPIVELLDDTTSLNQLLAVAPNDEQTPFASLALAMEAVAAVDRESVPILAEPSSKP